MRSKLKLHKETIIEGGAGEGMPVNRNFRKFPFFYEPSTEELDTFKKLIKSHKRIY